MSEVTERILRLRAEGAETVADLKSNISALKTIINETKIGTEEYNLATKELQVNQNAAKDAMYGSVESMDSLSKAARGTTETYNGLVHQMASYKSALRNTDVSTEEGKKQFNDLANKINDCNDKLKALDAMQGNYQRNVGNYQSAFKGLGEKVDTFKKGLEASRKGVGGVKDAFDGLGKSPAFLITGLLVSAVIQLANAFKDTEEGTKTTQAALVQLEPIMNFFKNVFATLAEWLGVIIEKVGSFLGKSGLFQKIIGGVMGVGNAIIQYVISPFKAVIAAIKVFKEEGIKGFKDAAGAFADEMKNGLSFKKNFEAGQAVGEAMTQGVKSKKKDLSGASKDMGTDAGEEFAKAFAKAIEEAFKKGEAVRSARQALKDEWDKQADELVASFEEGETELQDFIDNLGFPIAEHNLEEVERSRKAQEEYQKMVEERTDALWTMAGVTQDIFGSLADIYEADEENSERNAKRIKGLRIAEAIINTISGAVGAFMGITKDTGGWGVAAAAAEAAAVTAAGVAQITKIKNTAVSATGTTSGASLTAPSVKTELPKVQSVNPQTEIDRLTQASQPSKVYILQSDIQAAMDASKTTVTETSF